MKKILVFAGLVVLSPIVAGVYGVIHDQLTFTISPEYYTRFKFIQFGFISDGDLLPTEGIRIWVAGVGWMATWWMGIPIGIILGMVAFIQKDATNMWRSALHSIMITLVVAFVTGLFGLFVGFFILHPDTVSWWIPDHLKSPEDFVAVGSMHNYSYLGGLFGLAAGIFYQIRFKRKENVTYIKPDQNP